MLRSEHEQLTRLEEIVREIFPDSVDFRRNVRYPSGEVDLLVEFDEYNIAFEAKATDASGSLGTAKDQLRKAKNYSPLNVKDTFLYYDDEKVILRIIDEEVIHFYIPSHEAAMDQLQNTLRNVYPVDSMIRNIWYTQRDSIPLLCEREDSRYDLFEIIPRSTTKDRSLARHRIVDAIQNSGYDIADTFIFVTDTHVHDEILYKDQNPFFLKVEFDPNRTTDYNFSDY